jgi:magnesium chelatase family protein
LLDRVDIQLRVARITAAQLAVSQDSPRLDSATARARVVQARGAAAERLAGTPWRINSEVPGTWFRTPGVRLPGAATSSIDRALERGGITMRGYDRILRVAWTIADLDGATSPTAEHVGRALYLRKAISS